MRVGGQEQGGGWGTGVGTSWGPESSLRARGLLLAPTVAELGRNLDPQLLPSPSIDWPGHGDQSIGKDTEAALQQRAGSFSGSWPCPHWAKSGSLAGGGGQPLLGPWCCYL